jgi:hypothetical protein
VWPKPGKEPLSDVDRAVLIAVHHQPTVPTTIRALVKWHVLLLPTVAAGLARIAFIKEFQHFPSEVTFVLEHLHEGIQAPIVVDAAIELLASLRMLFRDHLSLGKISDHHSALNQSVSDEMTCFVQTVTALVALLLRDALIDLG